MKTQTKNILDTLFISDSSSLSVSHQLKMPWWLLSMVCIT